MRRQGVLGLIVGGPLLVVSPAAHAAQVVTWDTTSRYVDPAHEPFNPPPPGRPPRANALRVNVYLPDGYDGKRPFPSSTCSTGTATPTTPGSTRPTATC